LSKSLFELKQGYVYCPFAFEHPEKSADSHSIKSYNQFNVNINM